MGTSNTLLSVMTNTGHVNTRYGFGKKIMLLSVPYKRGTILKGFVITGLGSTAGGGPRSGTQTMLLSVLRNRGTRLKQFTSSLALGALQERGRGVKCNNVTNVPQKKGFT